MRAVLALAIALLLAACSTVRPAEPVPAQCNPICLLPCTSGDGDLGVRWEADPSDPDAWDSLGGDVVPTLADKTRQCELRRKACAQCLQRLDKAGVIEL